MGTTTYTPATPTQIVTGALRAYGPATMAQLTREVLEQCRGVDTMAHAQAATRAALDAGLAAGLVEVENVDEVAFFDLTTAGYVAIAES